MSDTCTVVQRQLAALGCPRYEIMVLQRTASRPDGFVRDRRQLSTAGVMASVAGLRRFNARNCDVFVLPLAAAGQPVPVLVDDLTAEAVAALRARVPVAVVTETSPCNYQAWVPVAASQRLTAVSRWLADSFGGDPASIAGGSHLGRLAGFTNRKSKHRKANGLYPYVRLHHAETLQPIALPEMEAPSKHTPRPGAGHGASAVKGGRDTSASGKDYGWACHALATGHDEAEVIAALAQRAEARGKRDPADYAQRTVAAARR